MVTSVRIRNTDHAQILFWLQEHVGNLLHCQPIIFWQGQGWHMKMGRYLMGDICITVEFDDSKHAVWFELIWG